MIITKGTYVGKLIIFFFVILADESMHYMHANQNQLLITCTLKAYNINVNIFVNYYYYA